MTQVFLVKVNSQLILHRSVVEVADDNVVVFVRCRGYLSPEPEVHSDRNAITGRENGLVLVRTIEVPVQNVAWTGGEKFDFGQKTDSGNCIG